ncbi:MAG: hypothetical protein CMN04_07760 [Roseibacillus sp.]|nr:hypothetical protein [Roseibacillus sp.]|tara:strand:- start:22167 stop:25331 length:3165 start_codon:yes stop_codon:yes gene_type:complete
MPKHASLLILICFSPLLPAEDAIDFNRDIRPILSSNCFLCHGPDAADRKANLRLDTREGAVRPNDGVRAIDPEKLTDSEILYRIISEDEDEVMPPPDSHMVLSAEQKSLLKRWVLSGGEYKEHWAFLAPVKAKTPPSGNNSQRISNPVDSFILGELAKAGLKPSGEADRRTLIRRITYDLTGLPPAPSDVEEFVNDTSPQAYEKVVDRLLGMERYGERMALAWMDAARYGDSSVMHADGPRDMWAWRDWVIDAYNSNMPFDRFTTEQLAGDLLPDATVAQRVASGFNRNHATSDEGGAFAEELRVEYVVDRVKTTANVWMGMTMECAQCHDHKYDPITQREYYQMFAYFNNTTDPGMQTRGGNQSPVVNVPPREQARKLADLRKAIEASDQNLKEYRQNAATKHLEWLRVAEKSAGDALPEPAGLAHFFPLNERGGKQIKASVGGGVGQIGGRVYPAKRGNGGGLRFDGKTAITFESWPSRERNQAFTFAAWLKVPDNGNGAVVARIDVGQNYRGYDLWLQKRSIGTHIVSSWPQNALKVVSAQPLAADKWQHVVVMYDGSSKASGIKIFVDGKLVANKVEQDSLKDSIVTQTPFKIGSRSKDGNYNGEVDELRIYNRALSEAELQQLGGDPIKAILAISPISRTPEQKTALLDYFLSSKDEQYQQLTAAHDALLAEESGIKGQKGTSVMVMQDNAANKARKTYILDRGAYDQPIKEGPNAVVNPGVPAILPKIPEGASSNRLGLAKWLTTGANPLTARVAVNRYWALLFGRGLVKSVDDFGNQGSPPSHPELLDWLAVDFVESGWNVKRMLKQIALSATYRQASRLTPQLAKGDPENILLARSPRFRLQGEFIRDTALDLSGLLVEKVGGPSVKPYQPSNIWNEVSLNGGLRYKRDNGEKLYRRSMYTYWKRSAPMPNMLIFDAPTREKCMIQRPITNTPLQALVTLNDPQFVEAARALGQRLIKEGGKDTASRIDYGFKLALSRPATDKEAEVIERVLDDQLTRFRSDPNKAKEFLAVGEVTRDETIDAVEHAAWMVVGQLLLNMDETLTRG